MRPLLAVSIAVVAPILFEGASFGLFTTLQHVYDPFYKRITPVDVLVLIAVAAVALDMLRERRPMRYPRELRFPHLLLAIGMLVGIAMGKTGGSGLKSLLLAENLLAYLLVLPVAVANLNVEPRRLQVLLGGAFALAVLKAFDRAGRDRRAQGRLDRGSREPHLLRTDGQLGDHGGAAVDRRGDPRAISTAAVDAARHCRC